MIGGVPNVGKSTVINSLRKRDSEIGHGKKSGAKTGGVPCITKSISGFKVINDPPIFVVDTPGIIIPKISNSIDALKLCACHAIRDGIEESEVIVDFVLYNLNKQRNFTYVKRYAIKGEVAKPTDNMHDLLI